MGGQGVEGGCRGLAWHGIAAPAVCQLSCRLLAVTYASLLYCWVTPAVSLNGITGMPTTAAGSSKDVKWEKIKVGQVLKVQDNELFPADLLCLYTSLPDKVGCPQCCMSHCMQEQRLPACRQATKGGFCLVEYVSNKVPLLLKEVHSCA